MQFGIKVTLVEPGAFRTDFLNDSSVRFGANGIADYAAFSARTKSSFTDRANKQPGDPVKPDEALCEGETEKAVYPIEAASAGTFVFSIGRV